MVVMRRKGNTIYLLTYIILTMPLKSDYTASNDWIRVNNELGRMWNEVVMAQFRAASWHLPGGNDGNHEKPIRVVSVSHLIFKLGTSCVHVTSITA
jgi:hypothetical protein